LRLTGLELHVEHDAGGWRVLGLGNSNERQQAPLQSLPVDLDLHALKISIFDAPSRQTYAISSPHLRVVNGSDGLRFGGSVARQGSPHPITVIGRFDAARQDADLYMAGHDLDLAGMTRNVDLQGYALRNGSGDLELWGNWRGNRLQGASARFDLRALAIVAPAGRHAQLPALSGAIGLRRVADGFELRYRGAGGSRDSIDDAGGALAHLNVGDDVRAVTLAARDIDIAPLVSIAALLPQVPAALGGWIDAAHPHGRIAAAALRWRDNGDYALAARVQGIGAAPAEAAPGIDSFDATLRGDQEALSIEIPQQALTLRMPREFRWPFVLKRFGGTLATWREADGRHIGSDGIVFDNDDVGGEGRGEVVLPDGGGKPFVDVYALATHGKVSATKLFLPLTIPRSTIDWLDRGLVSGQVDWGRVAIRGDLADWPFVNHRGRFDAAGQVTNAVLNYGPDWPQAEQIDATAEFVDNSMVVEATHAQTSGTTVSHATATIADLGRGVLTVAAQGAGPGTSLLDFVRHSPVGHDLASTLSTLKVGGNGKFAFTLVLPFDQVKNFSLDGNLQISDADVAAKQWNLALQDVNGSLLFDAKGFRAPELKTKWHDVPATLSIALGSDTGDPSKQLVAALSGAFTPRAILSDYPDLAPLAKIASGTANFRIGFDIAAQGSAADAPKTLHVQSDLHGIALGLPAPLDKPQASSLPMDLRLGMPFEGAQIALALGDVLRARGRLPDSNARKPGALAVAFGSDMPTMVPAEGMTVGGRAPALDLGGWAQLATGGASSTQAGAAAAVNGLPALNGARISTGDALAFGNHLGPLSLDYATQADAHVITFDGAALAGTLTLPTARLSQRGITAQLRRLYWPEAPPPKDQTLPQTSPPPDALSGVAPSALPPLHISVADLRLGNSRLGETHFESAPTSAGMRVTRMDTQSKDARIRAHGDWNGSAQASRSQFTIDIAAGNLGRMLEAFGYGGLISGGQNAHAVIDGSWPGAPSAFSLANLDGTLKVDVGEGRIVEVQPGMGRLLGLFSITQLPRRLTLDFGDVYKSGFGFNSIAGSFRMADGNAYTDNLEIKGAAADIRMRGRTGLRAHDYDQTVDVTPHTGGALAVVGAVVGGPIGAAAGLALSRGINRVAHARYSITGSWTKPVITTLSKTVAKPASASSKPAPAASSQPPAAAGSGS
ncbi:MAG TPA: YhdP family protein, partial [Rhodanobacteraceae bacterium]